MPTLEKRAVALTGTWLAMSILSLNAGFSTSGNQVAWLAQAGDRLRDSRVITDG